MSKSKNKGIGIWNKVDSDILTQAYKTSLQQNPQFHDPNVVNGTADKDAYNYDFLTWCSGVRSCMADSNLKNYILNSMGRRGQAGTGTGTGTTGQPTQVSQLNLPDNVRQAMSHIQGSGRRVRSFRVA